MGKYYLGKIEYSMLARVFVLSRHHQLLLLLYYCTAELEKNCLMTSLKIYLRLGTSCWRLDLLLMMLKF